MGLKTALTQTPPIFIKKFQFLGQLCSEKLPNSGEPCTHFVVPSLRWAGLLHDSSHSPRTALKKGTTWLRSGVYLWLQIVFTKNFPQTYWFHIFLNTVYFRIGIWLDWHMPRLARLPDGKCLDLQKCTSTKFQIGKLQMSMLVNVQVAKCPCWQMSM